MPDGLESGGELKTILHPARAEKQDRISMVGNAIPDGVRQEREALFAGIT